MKNLKAGDRVVVPVPIACGACNACSRGLTSLCENSNPNAATADKLWGDSTCGIFGYSHATGGYAGGQAEYARVPFADVGPIKIDAELADEQVLFLSDVFPTGWMGAELCDIKPGDVVAVWGAGPVGQFAIASAYLLGAEKVIAIDRFDYRLKMAREKSGAVMNRGLTIKTGQCHVHRYLRPLLRRIENGDIDPSFIVTHRMSLDDAPDGYETFKNKQDECVKVVMTP